MQLLSKITEICIYLKFIKNMQYYALINIIKRNFEIHDIKSWSFSWLNKKYALMHYATPYIQRITNGDKHSTIIDFNNIVLVCSTIRDVCVQ